MEITDLNFTATLLSCCEPDDIQIGEGEKSIYIKNLNEIVHGENGMKIGVLMLAIPGSSEFGKIWPKDCKYMTVNGCYLTVETGSIEMTENLKAIAHQNSNSIAGRLNKFGVPYVEMPL